MKRGIATTTQERRETVGPRASVHAPSGLIRQTTTGGGMRVAAPPQRTAQFQMSAGSVVRIGFGMLWLIDAGMKWTPGFQGQFADIVKAGADGQPGWLAPWYRFWEAAVAIQPGLFALGTAIVETLIAVALIIGFVRMSTYVIGALWSLGIWAVPEGFGNDDRAMSTDVGTSIVYVVVFLALLALDQGFATRPWSLDRVIERRLPWWRRIAEVRKGS